MVFQRLLAVLIIVIPGFGATYGWILMKNTLFASFQPNVPFQWLPFLLGFVLFVIGVAFIAGWIFFRDRKRNYLAPRFMPKRKKG